MFILGLPIMHDSGLIFWDLYCVYDIIRLETCG